MRYLSTGAMALILAFNAVAKLEPEEQKLADMLLSGDMTQLKSASKQIYNSEISEPELLDIGAEILLKKYPDAVRSDIDSLAWLARAIGASENGRYYNVLSEVVEHAQNDKLERHADTALDELPGAEGEQYVAGGYALPEGLYTKDTDAEVISRLKQKMLAGDLSNLKQAAREMASRELRSEILGDIAAEILLTHYKEVKKNQVDTFAWLTNAIGRSKMARYRDVLREIEDNGEFRKLRRYAESNLDELPEEAAEQYQKGMFNEPIPDYTF